MARSNIKLVVAPLLNQEDRKQLSAFVQLLKRARPFAVAPGASFSYRGSLVTVENRT